MNKTAFFDLNGTLVQPVVVDRLDELQLIPDAASAVARLCQVGFRCPVVTVQSRIAKGAFTEPEFLEWFRRFAEGMKARGALIDGPYVCPHRFATLCPCKKPNTLLYERAAAEHAFQLPGAFVIGDSAADMEAAERFGGVGCLVRTGWAEAEDEFIKARPHAKYVANTLAAAVDWILTQSAA